MIRFTKELDEDGRNKYTGRGASKPSNGRYFSTEARGSVKPSTRAYFLASGHGNWQMCGVDEHGFPIRHRQRKKVHFGYQTGDLVRAVVPTGARAGTHVGRVLARASGSFDLRTKAGRQAGISYRYCRPIHRNDGYRYQQGGRHAVPATQST